MNDFERLYLCNFISEIEYLTISEIEKQFSLKIDRSQIGLDRGGYVRHYCYKNRQLVGNV